MSGVEEKLLLELTRAVAAGSSFADPPRPAADLVRRHRLGPLAFRLGLGEYRADFAASALRAELRLRQLARVTAHLEAAGVAIVLLKGVSYATSLYADPAERPMADIDLLVEPHRYAEARRALAELGYRGTGSRFHHGTMLVAKDSVIDLHRSIISPLCSQLDLAAIWSRARPATERDDGALRLDPIDEALFHFINLGRTALLSPLLSYVDGARLLARLDDADLVTLRVRAQRYRVARAVDAAVTMTNRILNDDGADDEGRWLATSLADLVSGAELSTSRRGVRVLALCDSPREAAGRVAQWVLERGEHATTALISRARTISRRARTGARSAGR